jgi:FtsH-binding integral membrane protein
VTRQREVSTGTADIIRYIVMGECLLSIGYLLARIFTGHLSRAYLYMAVSLLIYSIFAIITEYLRLGQHLTWRAPVIFVASTVLIIGQLYQRRRMG